jgi:hypothetical protein
MVALWRVIDFLFASKYKIPAIKQKKVKKLQ